MELGKLTVQVRNTTGKGVARKLRAQGLVPGVCYGVEVGSLPIVVDPKALRRSLDPAKRHNTVIEVTLEGDGGGKRLTAMLKDYQVSILDRELTHVDLISIDPNKPVTVEVPLVFTGRAAGLVDGGQLHVVMRTLTVRCKPTDIPVQFELDVTPLMIGDAFHVSDVATPAGVELLDAAKLAVVTVTAPVEEKVEVPVAAEGAVLAEGAAPAEGEAAAAPAADGKAPAADAKGAAPAAKGAAPAAKADDKKGGKK